MALFFGAVVPAGAGTLSAVLTASRHKVEFEYDNGSAVTPDVDELGLVIGESLTPWLALGLRGGYTSMDLDHHPAAVGYDLTGRYFGIVAQSEPTLIPGLLSLHLRAAYNWHDADNGRVDGQLDEFEWYTAQVRAGPTVALGPVELTAGGYLQYVDGEEKARGPLTFARDFNAAGAGGAFASVGVKVDEGSIRVWAMSGARKAYGISFVYGFL